MATGCAFLTTTTMAGWTSSSSAAGSLRTPSRRHQSPLQEQPRRHILGCDGQAGLVDIGWAQGVCVGDYNNDGFEDLFLTYYGQNRLYRNNGDGTFTNVTGLAGLLHPKARFSSGCTFLDYNRDGLLDLFVANYLEIDLATAPGPRFQWPTAMLKTCRSTAVPPVLPSPRTISTATMATALLLTCRRSPGRRLSRIVLPDASSFDVDEDGWPDIVVACDTSPSLLLMNNHDGPFAKRP